MLKPVDICYNVLKQFAMIITVRLQFWKILVFGYIACYNVIKVSESDLQQSNKMSTRKG